MKDHTDKIFKWLDLLRWLVYGLIAGTIYVTVWCVKIQMTLTDLEKRMNDNQQNTQMHRDDLKQKEVANEHRMTRLEEWISDHDLLTLRKSS